ncbi:hypothetical protein AX15_007545 [Amanita polypyramis BW_CC]|nr:hypothetical protein AX15_007545 [Amanita polypyramis BW_CC]
MIVAPFPDDVPTLPSDGLIVDFELIKARDKDETDRLWDLSKKLGFFYLKNHGVVGVDAMYDTVGIDTMALPTEEKMKFDQGNEGRSFGYKAAGGFAVDASGRPDTIEFMNIAKDDVVSWPKIAHRTYPGTVNDQMESTIIPFVRTSIELNDAMLEFYNERLGLPSGELHKTHTLNEHSGTEIRILKNPVDPNPEKLGIGAHTDFGTISYLHHRMGGLQTLRPGSETWEYVKPIPGYAVITIGDTLSILSGGIVRPNLHRVVPAPGEQAKYPRWSVVYLVRPGNSTRLNALVSESPIIAESVAKHPEKNFQTDETSEEWFRRRVKLRRADNQKGPETWYQSQGTEKMVHVQAEY